MLYNPTEQEFYTSLPADWLEIRPSESDRYGIFAKQRIKAGTRIGLARIEVNGEWIRNGVLGSVINHSNTPNCRMLPEWIDDFPAKILQAYHDVPADAELNVFYKMKEYSDAPWIDQSMCPPWA